jgi:hypothetical protein
MAKELNLRCALAPITDHLTVSREPHRKAADGTDLVKIGYCEDDNDIQRIAYLDERAARELFCWLGVELHKGGLA